MALDITAYRQIHPVLNPEYDSDGALIHWDSQWCPGETWFESESFCPGSTYPIQADNVYEWKDCYAFSASTYSWYDTWKHYLINMRNCSTAFQELIELNCGNAIIGSRLASKLLDDFKNHHSAAKQYSECLSGEDGALFYKKYCCWEKALNLAADNGAIEFC